MKIINLIVSSSSYTLKEDDKEVLNGYLKYLTGELLNNALYHSLSEINAVIAGQYFSKRGKIQICVIDRGKGFLFNLKEAYKVSAESDAIKKALEKGVSSPPCKDNLYYSVGHAGYGLYALRRIIEEINGRLIIISNNCSVKLEGGNIKILSEEINWKGVIVVFELLETYIYDILQKYTLQDFFKIFLWNEDGKDDEIF